MYGASGELFQFYAVEEGYVSVVNVVHVDCSGFIA